MYRADDGRAISTMTAIELANAFNARLVDETRHRYPESMAHQELYHAGLSVCSQKVRTVLAELEQPYVSHELSILNSRGIYSEELTPAENYYPEYVKLRMLGAKQAGLGLASGYSGSSAVSREGFDACVVPTLVDHEKDRVVVDSLRICEHLIDSANSTKRLLGDTASERADILQQASVVDRTPQPALLYGFHPDDDRRPEFIKAKMAGAYDLKIEALTLLRDQNLHDTELASAYTAKISKEAQGKRFAHDPNQQREVRATTRTILEQLSQRLERSQNLWVCGDTFTLADIFWGINLFRFQWLGLAHLWADSNAIQDYASRCFKRHSLWTCVIDYPSPMPPSPHINLDPPEDL